MISKNKKEKEVGEKGAREGGERGEERGQRKDKRREKKRERRERGKNRRQRFRKKSFGRSRYNINILSVITNPDIVKNVQTESDPISDISTKFLIINGAVLAPVCCSTTRKDKRNLNKPKGLYGYGFELMIFIFISSMHIILII